MTKVKAVIFDYIGTLVSPKNYSMTASIQSLYDALIEQNFEAEKEAFFDAYAKAHEKYRVIRYEQLKEVTNAVWVAEALNAIGFNVKPDDANIKAALNVFFKDYIDSFKLRAGAKRLMKRAMGQYKTGLISNFTYAPVIYSSLRKLGMNGLFNCTVVSNTIGWRKPSRQIFDEALRRLQVNAIEAVFIGDSPIEDIKGAKEAGLKTVFIPSQFNPMKALLESKQKPDYIVKKLEEIQELPIF